jgi:phage terminase small subunit
MTGAPGRSGGRNAKRSSKAVSDGMPQSPRSLAPRAQALFGWICDKLGCDDPQNGFQRVDGAMIASLAEIMQSQEQVASLLADDPGNLGAHRLRNNLASQICRMSGILGLSPFDRSRQPEIEQEPDGADPFQDILARMSKG